MADIGRATTRPESLNLVMSVAQQHHRNTISVLLEVEQTCLCIYYRLHISTNVRGLRRRIDCDLILMKQQSMFF